MSDAGSPYSHNPPLPPPPPGRSPTSFGAVPAMSPPQDPPPPQSYAPTKPPRPSVAVGAGLTLGGGALVVLGSFLTWFTIEGQSYTGFSKDINDQTKDGPYFLVFGVVLIGFGIALLAARKVLAVTIIGIVVAAFTVIFALADLGTVSDAKDNAKLVGVDFSSGPGLYLCLLGALVALGGSIAATARRRR